MAEYLVCYDYGQGGVWLYLEARDAAEIVREYPTLRAFDAPPDWWTEELEAAARKFDPTSSFGRDWLKKLEQ